MTIIPSTRLSVTPGPPATNVLGELRADLAAWFVRTIPSTNVRGLLALIATGLLWGMVVVGPEVVEDASATSIVGGRFVILGLVSLIVGRHHLRDVPWGRALRYGFTGFVGYYLLLVLAIQQAGAAPAAAVIGVTPVLYALAGARRERLDVRRLAGPMFVLLVGLGMVQIVDLRSSSPAGMSSLLLGLGLALASVLVWIWYGLDNAAYLVESGRNGTQWTSAVGVAAGALGLPFLIHGVTIGGGVGSSTSLWLLVVIVLGMGSAWLGTVAWNAASTLLPSTVIGPLLVIELLIALVYAHLWAGSWPAPLTMAGYAILVFGVILSVMRVDRLRASLAI